MSLLRPLPDGGERLILEGISACFEPGSLTLISGAIGAGKSSLLYLLSGLLRPSAGELLADGEVISRASPAYRDRWRRRVGLLFQTPHLLERLDVLENVMLPLIPSASSLRAARRAALAELERLRVLHLAQRGVAGLSGGERQRVGLAQALVKQPRFLFVDEPSAHQDQEGVEMLIEQLVEARQRGAVVLLLSHDPRLLQAKIADQRWRLEGGKLRGPL